MCMIPLEDSWRLCFYKKTNGQIPVKVWALRDEIHGINYRIFYILYHPRQIILLHAFAKKSNKIPLQEIELAEGYYMDFIKNLKIE
ncbi:MAG: hypothetical protein G01um101418_653 [Parcubacteria group bacterium Gr01-1014_18]|nr:MAG: hypothetical protein Greene041636_636 [Parcubacteria group bacterium Greene0416_36]TSC80734.1 MAG: hypothetical protein G01um101418_653 [Parcubacteria group bacterium Gr01-1014_18]TSC98655.1 MAG: hypothetical protein Greene101420_614 [Parcubacteria group bacterium Greene1014_20]TSD07185.1 MAG: hypothetical protein Greene07142_354 [Parcubacteria group bacterium Greene0714_2]